MFSESLSPSYNPLMFKIFFLIFISFNLHAGTLVLIGGGHRPTEALKYFVQKTQSGPIYVLPWGTDYPEDSFSGIKSELEKLGAMDVQCFCADEFGPDEYHALARAGGVYFPGGDQNKIMSRIFKSGTKDLIHSLYQNGVPVAGTSAGTAIQTNPMLTGSGSETAEGLGLLEKFIVDQHFLAREREGRLLGALELFPRLNGMGIDESMSAVIENSRLITALGPSHVILYIRTNDGFRKIKLSHQQTLKL